MSQTDRLSLVRATLYCSLCTRKAAFLVCISPGIGDGIIDLRNDLVEDVEHTRPRTAEKGHRSRLRPGLATCSASHRAGL
jgi:hypothetical protein